MKFLLDMGLAQSTAHDLRTHGYDAVHLRDQGCSACMITTLCRRRLQKVE
jgi:predicted nuclease of predicted toxin-antitoxin system